MSSLAEGCDMTLALRSNVKRTGRFGGLRLQLMFNIVLAVD